MDGRYLILIALMAIIVLNHTTVFARDQWDKQEKMLFGAFLIGQIINYGQTNKVLNDPNWYEGNPFMPADTTSELIAWKAASSLAIYLVADQLPRKYRKPILWGANIVVFSFVGYDLMVGVGFKF